MSRVSSRDDLDRRTETDASVPISAHPELDRLVQRVAAAKDRWVRLPQAQRLGLLRDAMNETLLVAEDWVGEACAHRGIDPASPLAGEEWISGPMTLVRNLRLHARELARIDQPHDLGLRQVAADQVAARVFPGGLLDRLLWYDMSAEVWLEPGQPATRGAIYRQKAAGETIPGRVALVLGAGNVSSIGPLDFIYKLYAEDQVAILKLNPVNVYLAPFFERIFSRFIDEGYLAIVTGGGDVGTYLCRHAQIDTIHLTGSEATHDAIVWGADPAAAEQRKRSKEPLLTKPFSSELGCVTPVLVVPGRWSNAELEFHAFQVASMVAHNASFNCNAAKVLVLSSRWPQREAFLARIRAALALAPPRLAYYPGAEQRYRGFLEAYPQALALGRRGDGVVPWTLIPDVPARDGEYAFSNEAFCGVLAVTDLDAADAGEFLERSVEFANESLHGNLSATLLIDGATQRSHQVAYERAIAGLRYGGVGVNVWSAVLFALGVTTWGAYPGNPPEAISSGAGVVHNAYLFDHPQKSVVRARFRIWPKPVWFAGHRTLLSLGRLLMRYEARPDAPTLARLLAAGLGG